MFPVHQASLWSWSLTPEVWSYLGLLLFMFTIVRFSITLFIFWRVRRRSGTIIRLQILCRQEWDLNNQILLQVITTETAETSYNVTGLSPFTVYSFKVGRHRAVMIINKRVNYSTVTPGDCCEQHWSQQSESPILPHDDSERSSQW